MTQLPPDELAALPDDIEIGTPVLELGNKKNSTGLYRDWYMDNGLMYECVDWNGEDGAWKFDMREPGVWHIVLAALNEGRRFQLVTNFGFTEHVGETIEEQLECWNNVHNLVDVGGTLAICMPMMPDWKGHGQWMPNTRWYSDFAAENGYNMNLQIWERKRRTIVATMVKVWDWQFTAPDGNMERSDR